MVVHTDNTDRRINWGCQYCEDPQFKGMFLACPKKNEPARERAAKGGNACLKRHGPEFYREIANKRWHGQEGDRG